MKKIVLTGGGTAGHVVPCVALLPNLKRDFDKIYYIGSHSGIEKKIIAEQAVGVPYHSVTTVKLRRSVDLRNLMIPFKLLKGVSEAKCILKELKPDVVFSKGGFVAYPVVRAAAKLGIPIVAHESDMTMGLANRMSAKYCSVICTTFKKTAQTSQMGDKSGKRQPKMVYTGSPLREEIYNGISVKVEKRHGFGTDKGNLLVFGGSLGATKINEAVRSSLGDLLAMFNIVHICGKGKIDESLREAGIASSQAPRDRYVQLEYVNDIQNYFAWADVVVARAGSNSVCELLALKKPTLFIPLATGRGDQIENAKEVLKSDAAAVLWEEEMTSKNLVARIDEVYENKNQYDKNAEKMGDIDGTKRIAEIVVKSLKR